VLMMFLSSDGGYLKSHVDIQTKTERKMNTEVEEKRKKENSLHQSLWRRFF
jgi:hypothetical protein